MLDGISAVGGPGRVTGPAPRTMQPVEAEFRVPQDAASDEAYPPVPPPEVLASLDKAARVIDELAARQVNLRFAVDEKTRKVEVEVRDENGKLVRMIPQSRALDALAGDLTGLGVELRA